MDIDPNSWSVSFPGLKLLSRLEVRARLNNNSLGFLNDLKDFNEEDTTDNIRNVRIDNDTLPADIFRAVPLVKQVLTMALTIGRPVEMQKEIRCPVEYASLYPSINAALLTSKFLHFSSDEASCCIFLCPVYCNTRLGWLDGRDGEMDHRRRHLRPPSSSSSCADPRFSSTQMLCLFGFGGPDKFESMSNVREPIDWLRKGIVTITSHNNC